MTPLVNSSRDEWSELLTKVGNVQDKEAFSQLFGHFAPLIKGFLMKGAPFGYEQAEELAQEAMIKVWRKAGSFDEKKSSASTWIYTIARNCRIDWFRREARIKKDLKAEDLYDLVDENPAHSSLIQKRNQTTVRENLQVLPVEQLEVITKIYYEGKTHSEVAEELALPLGTVKSRIRLALKKMNIQLESLDVRVES
ncbi:MAG: sigma-70 family RNA polymerase sigma factor [Pseudomonadales bacterium]|nr:sigma-70 family RNA polymerase sigma factor [Pseudomonadales bacterium]